MPRARGVLRIARKLTWLRIHCHVYEEHTDEITISRINFGESPWQRETRQGIFCHTILFFILRAQTLTSTDWSYFLKFNHRQVTPRARGVLRIARKLT